MAFKSFLSLFATGILASTPAVASERLTQISTEQEFSQFAMEYYRDPRPDLIDDAIRFIATSRMFADESRAGNLVMTFSCLFDQYPDKKPAWRKDIDALEEPKRNYLINAIEREPAELLALVETSPSKNDMTWGCFFVTGDERYVEAVIAELSNLDERNDLNLYLTASSAQWSLASIGEDHEKVRAALKNATRSKDAAIAIGARDALTTPPATLRARMVKVVREQKDAGVWK